MKTPKEMALLAARALSDKKGKEIQVLEIGELTTLADYFVIATGSSNTQINALVDNVEKVLHEEAEEEPADRQAGSFLVKKAVAYMEQNYAKKLSLQDVADYCYVSQWHLSKLINRHAGKTYYDLLNAIRIQKAKELLADPSLKIGDIVEMVGYADGGHFARTFKKLEGVSASEYRNRLG